MEAELLESLAEAKRGDLLNESRIDAVNRKRHQIVCRKMIVSGGFPPGDILRRDAVDSESDQVIIIKAGQSSGLHIGHKFRRDAVNAKRRERVD